MEQEISLPKEYRPYEELEFFSNRAIGYQLLIKASSFSPLLIGKGEQPLIWLAQRDIKDQKKWAYLVYANRPFHPKIKVLVFGSNVKVVAENAENVTLVHVEELTSAKARLLKLDLRPIGLNIFGEESRLMIGSNSLSGSTIMSVANVIAIG